MKQWYEELFQDFADNYDKEDFTRGTTGEVDFIEREINFNREIRILDIGCGTGRHSLELSRRGYNVTGIDLSPSMIEKAKRLSLKENLRINLQIRDARDFSFRKKFGLAIMLCEGAFPLMENDEMNFKILKNAYKALEKGGKLIFTTLNGLFPLFHSVKDFINSGDNQGTSLANSFDLMTFRDHSIYEIKDDNGNRKSLKCNERYYIPSEITWLLKSAGFTKSQIYGCKLGAFSKDDSLSTEDFEMLVIAEK